MRNKKKKTNAQLVKGIYELDKQLIAEGKRPLLTEKCRNFLNDLIEKYGDQDDDIFNLKFNKGLIAPDKE